MKMNLKVCSGMLLLAISMLGVTYACRLAAAQDLYFRAISIREARGNLKDILNLCESADRIYRHNYLFCILAAQEAYYTSFGAGKVDAEQRIIESERWCNAGLKQNHYRVQLRKLKAYLLACKSAQNAISYWEEYVDWHFWEPANHTLLVELYSLSGQYEKALDSLALIRNTPYYSDARKKMIDAWDKESSLPPEFSAKQANGPQR